MEYFQQVYDAFQQAVQTAGFFERAFSIGDLDIVLRFAGGSLVPHILPAFSHLADSSRPAKRQTLTVCLWDTASTGREFPPPLRHGQLTESHYSGGRVKAVYQPVLNTISLLDYDRSLAIFWTPSPDAVPYFESSAPLRTILAWWMSERDLNLIHAAAVGVGDGGCLIGGRGGSGKSTTALACLEAGLDYAGDDYVLAGLDPEPYVYSLYCTAKLNPDNLHRFPSILPFIDNPGKLDSEKAYLYLSGFPPANLCHGFTLRAVLIPTVTGRSQTSIRAITGAQALLAIGPSTIFQLPGSGGSSLIMLKRLLAMIPCYLLELGTDLKGIVRTIRGLLASSRLTSPLTSTFIPGGLEESDKA